MRKAARRFRVNSPTFVSLGLLASLGWAVGGAAAPSSQQASQALARLERGWVANAGQWDEQAAFAAPGFSGVTWVTKEGELRHVLVRREDSERAQDRPELRASRSERCPSRSWVLSERFVGGRVKTMRGEEELGTRVSYFIGKDPATHRSNLPSFRIVSLGEVWPGVEVKLQAKQETVEKLLILRPEADVNRVQVALSGAEGLELVANGALKVRTGLGEVELSAPVAWQELGGQRQPVSVAYRLVGQDRYGFALGAHDPNAPVVIDPILQSTYLGGSNDDMAFALALASSGDVYVAGYTGSANFPSTSGGAQTSYGGLGDAFVARLNGTLTTLSQAAYLGGSDYDYGRALTLSGSGEVVMVGWTRSVDFPGTSGGAQGTFGGGDYDAFAARLNPQLTTLNQATYLGGSDSDSGSALAISTGGEVIVAGWTASANFPGTSGGAQAILGGGVDAFVARLNAQLTTLNKGTYLGGSGNDRAKAMVLASSGEVCVAGQTESANFPGTAGGAQASHGGGLWDSFLARLSPQLTTLNQATYLGGSVDDEAHALALTSTGQVLVAGGTTSTNFPAANGGAQATFGGGVDAFVARLNTTLTTVNQSTYLGGSGDDWAEALAIANSGDVYVAGRTVSADFPGTSGGAQPSYAAGDNDAFVTRLSPQLTTLVQATYLGGSARDQAYGLALSGSGEVIVAGWTASTSFPAATGGARQSNSGSFDAFVARLSGDLRATSTTYTLTVVVSPAGGGTVTGTGIACPGDCSESFASGTTVTLTAAPSSGYSFSSWSGCTSSSGSSCTVTMNSNKTVTATFTPVGGGEPYQYWIPVVANLAGSGGSFFYSDVSVLNVGSAATTVNFTYYPAGGTVASLSSSPIPAGGQEIFRDIVLRLNRVGTKGVLRVGASQPVRVVSRTYNKLGTGNSLGLTAGTTFGQYVEAYPLTETMGAGAVAYLVGLTQNSAYRTNIAVANFGSAAASVTVTLYRGSGQQLASYTVSLNPGELKQENEPFVSKAGQSNLESGWAKVVVNSGSGVVAYASVLDNTATNNQKPSDPTTIPFKR